MPIIDTVVNAPWAVSDGSVFLERESLDMKIRPLWCVYMLDVCCGMTGIGFDGV